MVTVLVADDDALIRGGIVMLLEADPQVVVSAQAADGEEALALAASRQPDVVVMDIRMPGLDGIAATRRLTEELGGRDRLIKVLVLTTFNDDASVYGALRAGASGFVLKESAPKQLLPAVLAVASGRSWIDPEVAGQVITALSAGPDVGDTPSRLVARLTPREREVLVLLASGRSGAALQDELSLTEATVRTHISRILMKTACRDRAQAVVLAYQSGLVRARPR